MHWLNMIKAAIANLPRRHQHNLAKILCLGIGMAISAVLIAEVYFERTFDTWFEQADRTYIINECVVQNGEYAEYSQTSGAVAPGLRKACPQIEAATRITFLFGDKWFRINGKELKINLIETADSCFFDVFPQRQIAGNLRLALSRPFYVAISKQMADRIGGNVIGMTLKGREKDDPTLTIGAVYEDFPHGSSLHGSEVICALSTLQHLPGCERWTSRWVGTDRFRSYVRLREGTSPNSLKPNIDHLLQTVPDMKMAEQAGIKMDYSLTQLNEKHVASEQVKTRTTILLILAIVLLLSSVMNYLLITVGNLANRAREMGVRKCYGAGRRDIYGILFAESLVHVALAMVLAVLLLFVCRGTIEQLTAAPLAALFISRGSWILGAICLFVLLIGGLVPGWLYNRIPVAAAFRSFRDTHHKWKLALLAVEFASVGLLFSLLLVIHRQYNLMVNDNPGYAYSKLLTAQVNGAQAEDLQKALQELRRLPVVDKVSTCSTIPLSGASGNNVGLPGDIKELVNIADLYGVTDGYFDLMQIPIVQGTDFTSQSDTTREVMISQALAKRIQALAHWDSDIVGKKIWVSEHSASINHPFTIVGVYGNIRIGDLTDHNDDMSAIFHSQKPCYNLLIRLHELSPEHKAQVEAALQRLFPDREISINAYPEMMHQVYLEQHSFRSATMIAGLATLLIALMGLVGYTIDEVNRRRKEIAIRKVNGAHTRNILRLFMRNISWVALPSLAAGSLGAYLVAQKWLQLFAVRVPLSALSFVGCVAALMAVVLAVIVLNSYQVANSNPAEYLKQE